jgi:WD40 repeat protein
LVLCPSCPSLLPVPLARCPLIHTRPPSLLPPAAPSPSSSCTADAAFGAPPANAPASSIESACWDLHHSNTIALGSAGGAVSTIDLRTMKRGISLEGAHEGCVRVLHYNPNRPYVLLTAADDSTVKFWDLRKATDPTTTAAAKGAAKASSSAAHLTTLPGVHLHWPTAACFNRFHDQLLLTAGTDALVKLWRAASVSSAPPSELLDGTLAACC